MKKDILLKRIVLLIVSLFILVIILEIGLRISYPIYSNYNTEMWRYATESKQMSEFPGLGHEHIPNSDNMLYGVNVKINSLGLRSEKEYELPKPEGVVRILVIGDSITMGWGVEYNETYPKILENLLNENSSVEYEVLNAGVGNYNSVSELATMQKFMYLDPDIIVLGYYINDIEELTYPSKTGYFLKSKSYFYAFIMDKLINIEFRGKKDYKKYYSALYKDERLKNIVKVSVNRMIEIAKNNSLPFIFVNIPEFHGFKDYHFTSVNDFIEQDVIGNQDIYYLNLLPAFQKLPMPPERLWVSREDPHPAGIGQYAIAKNIYVKIKGIENGKK